MAFDTITGSGDVTGGTTANGQGTGIFLNDDAQANLVGSNDGVGLGMGDSFGAYGGGNTVTTQRGDELVLGQTGGVFDTIIGSGDLAGGTTANGQITGIFLNDNAQANLSGSSDTVTLGTGDSLGAYGGGNTVVTKAGDLVVIGQTNGNFDTLVANGDVSGGTTANGQGTSIVLNDNAQANLQGTSNNVSLGSSDVLTVLGGSASNTVKIYGNNSAVFQNDSSSLTVIGTPTNTAALNEDLSHSPATINLIDQIYGDVLGRGADPTGLANAEQSLGAGLSIQNFTAQLATSAEAAADLTAIYASFQDAPTGAEAAAFRAVMSAPYATPITIYGRDGVLASTSAANILVELPVLETLNEGRTLSLGLPNGSIVTFADTSRLVDVVYALAVQKSVGNTFVAQDFQADKAWLIQVDQPMLQVAEQFQDEAATYAAQGNQNRVILCNAAANIALQIAAQAPGARVAVTQRVNLSDHQTDVTVDPNNPDPFGSAVFHDINPGIGGVLQAIGLAVLNIAAAVFPETGLPYAAAAADLAESGNDFANGQPVGGILQLASAVGEFGIGLGAYNNVAGATEAGRTVLTAASGVGGIYGSVQNAQDGDALGVLASVLQATAAIAGGIVKATDGTVNSLATRVEAGLNISGTLVTTAAAFQKGDLAGGLITSLGAILTNVADDYNSQQAALQNIVDIAKITPATNAPSGTKIAFVGGLFDQTLTSLSSLTNNFVPEGVVHNSYENYLADTKQTEASTNVQYFNFSQSDELAAWIDQNNGAVTVLAHSWGADTAANVIVSNHHVDKLITIDPVSYVRPDFGMVKANTGFWANYSAVGGTGLLFPNAVAGIGSAWGTSPQGSASLFQNVNTDHASIASDYSILKILPR